MDKNFTDLGFVLDDASGKANRDELGNLIYHKGFSRHYDTYGGHYHFFFLKGVFVPTQNEYELWVKSDSLDQNHRKSLEEDLSKSFCSYGLDDLLGRAVNEFKERRGIPDSVLIEGIAPCLRGIPEVRVRGSNLLEVYRNMEKALIGLGYAEGPLPHNDQTIRSPIF